MSFLNWNTVPMNFNDSWTYLEMLGKCITQVDINARNIETNRQNIEINRQNIETNAANIEVNRQNIETNAANIETNRQKIASVETDLHTNYYTKAECDVKFVNAEDYYDKTAIDTMLTGYATLENLDSTANEIIEEVKDSFATIDMVDSLSRNIVGLETNMKRNGNSTYYDYNEDRFTITDNTVLFNIVPDSFSGVTVFISYTVESGGYTYEMTESIHVKPLKTSKRFIMYSMALGGYIECQNTTGKTFLLTVSKPTGTELITFTDISMVVYTASKEVTQEEKQMWYDKADCNADGTIDASDASDCLSFYAWLSTLPAEKAEELEGKTLDEKWEYFCIEKGYPQYSPYAPDVDLDGRCDARDASLILSFYTYTSTGGTGGVDGWYDWITGQIE